MGRAIRIDKNKGLGHLEALFHNYEAAFGALQSLEHRDDHSLATFEGERHWGSRLKLVLDPSGETRPPRPAKLVCRGTLYVGGQLERVAVFRFPSDRSDRPGEGPMLRAGGNGNRSALSRKSARGEAPGSPEGWADRGSARPWAGSPKMSEPPAAAALPELEPREYRVWFGTDRKPVDPADLSRGFSGARGGSVRYGHCDVFVPESHKIGSIGSSALRRLLTWTDDRLKLREIAGLESEAYWAAVAAQIGELEPGRRHAVVFIHGYNVSFEEAAIRAAQIGFDLGIGAMAFFSWPSKGQVAAYKSDSDTIEASEPAIADFLTDFARRSGADSVHVIVHSMGNKGVARAMKEILADAELRGGCRFGQIMLAAADVDAELFGRLAGAYKALSARTTLYVSQRDLALKGSAWLAEYPRVGFYPPVSVFDGIDTVSVSNIDLTLLGHGYVGEARDVLQDMHRLIFEGTPPPRFGLRPLRNDEGKTYWEVGA